MTRLVTVHCLSARLCHLCVPKWFLKRCTISQTALLPNKKQKELHKTHQSSSGFRNTGVLYYVAAWQESTTWRCRGHRLKMTREASLHRNKILIPEHSGIRTYSRNNFVTASIMWYFITKPRFTDDSLCLTALETQKLHSYWPITRNAHFLLVRLYSAVSEGKGVRIRFA